MWHPMSLIIYLYQAIIDIQQNIKSVYFGSNSAENRKDFKKGLEHFNFLDNFHYSLR